MSDLRQLCQDLINSHSQVFDAISRSELIEHAVKNKQALTSPSGALVTWAANDSTGRSPKDTYIVEHPESKDNIDWTSPNNIPLDPELFDQLFQEALEKIKTKEKLYITRRTVGADSKYCLPVTTITDNALTATFTDNMFRAQPDDISQSIFADQEFTLLALPYERIDTEKYSGKLRQINEKKTSNMIIAMDVDRKIGLVYGSEYCGSVKKMLFTTMNYLLPEHNILPLHCSANEGPNGDTAVFLGLSGTGKTTLSSDPNRALIGDDEHGWSDDGIANFENGCYAKLINLNPEKEPEIYHATFDERPYQENGCIIENTMMYPDGRFDLNDDRLTANSRTSYPLDFLKNIKPSATGGHPKTIIFLTADANGVLPPVAKLTPDQAMLWFLMGYTSKLAGTERGVTEPQTTFSRFFGEPFMPRNPGDYTSLLKEKIEKHSANVYLINTGWSGGPYGIGARMDISVTRAIVDAALNGDLENVNYNEDNLFHVMIPESCPNVDSNILNPKNTWGDKEAYSQRATKLACEFRSHFEKAYGHSNIAPEVKAQCPGMGLTACERIS